MLLFWKYLSFYFISKPINWIKSKKTLFLFTQIFFSWCIYLFVALSCHPIQISFPLKIFFNIYCKVGSWLCISSVFVYLKWLCFSFMFEGEFHRNLNSGSLGLILNISLHLFFLYNEEKLIFTFASLWKCFVIFFGGFSLYLWFPAA